MLVLGCKGYAVQLQHFLGEGSVARAQGSYSGVSQVWNVLWWLKDPKHKDGEMGV